MPAITINVAVIQENRILLTKREDFEVWCLPSGGVEEGESLAQAAIRETKEETEDNLSFGHRKRIEDALHGIGGGVVVTQELVLPVG